MRLFQLELLRPDTPDPQTPTSLRAYRTPLRGNARAPCATRHTPHVTRSHPQYTGDSPPGGAADHRQGGPGPRVRDKDRSHRPPATTGGSALPKRGEPAGWHPVEAQGSSCGRRIARPAWRGGIGVSGSTPSRVFGCECFEQRPVSLHRGGGSSRFRRQNGRWAIFLDVVCAGPSSSEVLSLRRGRVCCSSRFHRGVETHRSWEARRYSSR